MAANTDVRFSSNFLELDLEVKPLPPAGTNPFPAGDGGGVVSSPVGVVSSPVLPPSTDTPDPPDGSVSPHKPIPTNPFSAVDEEDEVSELATAQEGQGGKADTVKASPAVSDAAFSDHFDPSLEPGFDFVAHLDTRDSVSSLDKLPGGVNTDVSEGICSDHAQNPSENGVGNGDAGRCGVANGITMATEGSESKQNGVKEGNWEKFEEPPSVPQPQGDDSSLARKLQSAAKQSESGGGGAVCAADAMVSESAQWMALGDSHGFDADSDGDEGSGLPFRKTQSMRATTNKRIQIVDSLNKRRLSNSSLDREPHKGSLFKDEDELTRKYKIAKEYQVFVRMEKRVPGTRSKWLPVNISIKDNILTIKQSAPPTIPLSLSSSTVVPPDAPPLHEIKLCHNHALTSPVSRMFDRKTKIHQIKLRKTQIKERRTFRRWLFVEHVSKIRTIVKLGCPDQSVVKNMSDQIGEAIRQLPVTRDQGVAYRMNEVFVDVKDYSDILMNCDGAVLERRSLNRIYIQAFLNDSPDCRLVLNNIEAILLQGKGQMTNSMSRQVRLNEVVLHPCADKALYKKTREIKFRPVDGYPFELLRASIDPFVSPPVNVTALMEYNEQRNTVRITSSFSVRKKHNIKIRPVKDLHIKFPIPSSWNSLFLTETVFGGTKSVRSTSSLRGSFRRKIKTSSCQIDTLLGSAKYEPEHGSIIWRIGNYVETEVPHTFRCDIQLSSGMHRPDVTKEYAEVSFTLPGSSTGLQIRAFKVDRCTPERWVKYEILYHYRVQLFPDLSID